MENPLQESWCNKCGYCDSSLGKKHKIKGRKMESAETWMQSSTHPLSLLSVYSVTVSSSLNLLLIFQLQCFFSLQLAQEVAESNF